MGEEKKPLTAFLKTIIEHTKNWRRSFKLIWSASPFYTTAWAVLLLIQGILPGLLVYLTKLVVDSLVIAVNSQGEWGKIEPAVWYIAITASVMLLSDVFQSLLEMVRTAQSDIIQDYVKNLIHDKSASMDLSHFESHEYHDRLEQATSDGANRPLSLLESFGGLIQNTITLILMGGILVQYSWWVPIILLASTLPAFIIILRFDRIYNKWWKNTTGTRRWIQYFDVMLTHPNAVLEIRAFNLSPYFQANYQKLRKNLRSEKLSQLRKLGIAKMFSSALGLFMLGGAIALIGWRAFYGLLTLGDLALFYQAINRSQGILRSLLGSLSQMINNSLFLNVLFEFLDLQSNITDPDTPVSVPQNLNYGIEFDKVSFRYPGTKKYIFRDFSLRIPSGKIVAIVGENGSGKTTLIKLICRFYDPESGKIEFDGTNIKNFSIKSLRELITITYQMPLNYHATVNESISMGNLENPPLPDEIEIAAKRAGAHEFISNLPDKYETLLGRVHAKGAELSGGEWQRLALARAYFRQAPIILLDEPTSFLDSWAETDWFNRFRELSDNKTGVVITHRFTIAMRADIIFVIDKGRIVETGTHQELIKINGLYAKSWKEQMQLAENKLYH